MTVLNVKDFDTLGDQTTDDSAAIEAAFKAMRPGDVLHFPQGTYRVERTIDCGEGETS